MECGLLPIYTYTYNQYSRSASSASIATSVNDDLHNSSYGLRVSPGCIL